jgi:hypothetical protein
LPRRLGAAVGRSRADVQAELRLSFVKIVEYQRRGLVHVHAVIRADGANGTQPSSAPVWVTPALLADAVVSAAGAVGVRVEGGTAGSWLLRWGTQVEAHPIEGAIGGAGAGRVAAYVAKYATKGTEVTGWDSRMPRSDGGEGQAAHAAAMVRTAIELSEVPELAGLRLGRWAKELAYRGHVSSKSRHYSTTLGALRAARRGDAAARSGAAGSSGDLRLESSWRLVSRGLSPGASVLARGIARDVEINSAAAREAGAARPRAGGWDSARRDSSERERGTRRESHVSDARGSWSSVEGVSDR